jgi:Phospholipase_D-nuclease N-terminal
MDAIAAVYVISMIIGGIAGIIITIVSTVWVYQDAKKRGNPNAVVWAIGVFLFWILGLPLYLLSRNSTPSVYVLPGNGPAILCATCGKYAIAIAASAFCPLCGARRLGAA